MIMQNEIKSGISVRKIAHSKIHELDFEKLEFGKHISDHMLLCDYDEGEWQSPVIVPFANLSLSPATLALHYGQTVFEGMKAFRMHDGKINLFRLDRHYERFVRSLDRMCMAHPPREIFTEGLRRLIEIDKAWVPTGAGTSLYVRPFIYASEVRFGVKVSDQYRFVIFTGPVPELFAKPVKVKVETQYVRAARGGTGFAKCGGNYGAAYYPLQLARKEGFDQVLWTDAKENQFIEESGTMNVMFVIDDVLVTPPLSDTILDGVTRDSLLTLANDMGIKTEERPVSLQELEAALRSKSLKEAFGAGTAAVVAPIQLIHLNGVDFYLPQYNSDSLLSRIKTELERIRTGLDEDRHGWNHVV